MHIATDIWGEEWIVAEVRHTAHGFDVLLGRGRGRGGARVIVTRPLADYMDGRRHMTDSIKTANLPISKGAAQRVRRLLGHHRYLDSAAWWHDRTYDLASLTLEEFATKHGRTVGAVERARLTVLGKILRPAGWWREHAHLITSRPVAEVCDRLDLSAVSVRRLRAQLMGAGCK